MNRSPWRLEEVDDCSWRLEEVDDCTWRLEEVDGGHEQYPVESHFAVCHTPPAEQDPRFNRSAPTQVCFLCFAVRHTPPDEQDPCFDRSAPTQVRFIRFAVRQASFLSPISSKPVGSHAFCCLPMNTAHSVASP